MKFLKTIWKEYKNLSRYDQFVFILLPTSAITSAVYGRLLLASDQLLILLILILLLVIIRQQDNYLALLDDYKEFLEKTKGFLQSTRENLSSIYEEEPNTNLYNGQKRPND